MSRRDVVLFMIASATASGMLVTAHRTSPTSVTRQAPFTTGPEFEPNRGQAEEGVLFAAAGSGSSVKLGRAGARLGLRLEDGRTTPLEMRFVGASAHAPVHAEE